MWIIKGQRSSVNYYTLQNIYFLLLRREDFSFNISNLIIHTRCQLKLNEYCVAVLVVVVLYIISYLFFVGRLIDYHGGGAAIRAAAKAAGIGVVNSGFRNGFPSVPTASEQSMMRTASKQVSASISSETRSKIDDLAGVQRPSWELDEWEFADGEEVVTDRVGGGFGGEQMPRVVFGGVPTLQEAQDATSELKDVIDNVYLSSPMSSGYGIGHVSGLQLYSSADFLENKSSISRESRQVGVTKSAMQAFTMLSESPAAQTVVASIASDPNVWTAIMQNDALIGFLESSKTVPVVQDDESPKMYEESSDETKSEDSEDSSFFQNLKLKVSEIVTDVYSYLQGKLDFFSGTNSKEGLDGKTKGFFSTDNVGANSFMALAVMVIMVVVLKRP